MAPPQGACGRGCAPVPKSSWGRGLFERSEFRSPNLSGLGQRHPKGHARAPMVLGPFAETKGPRRAGPKPRKHLPFCHPDISNRGSSVFVVGSCLWSLHSYPRHPMAPPQGACGRGCAPVPKSSWGRGLFERSEFRSPTFGTGAKAPEGPRPGANGFGSFCRNKRTSACGAETPQNLSLSVPPPLLL